MKVRISECVWDYLRGWCKKGIGCIVMLVLRGFFVIKNVCKCMDCVMLYWEYLGWVVVKECVYEDWFKGIIYYKMLLIEWIIGVLFFVGGFCGLVICFGFLNGVKGLWGNIDIFGENKFFIGVGGDLMKCILVIFEYLCSGLFVIVLVCGDMSVLFFIGKVLGRCLIIGELVGCLFVMFEIDFWKLGKVIVWKLKLLWELKLGVGGGLN